MHIEKVIGILNNNNTKAAYTTPVISRTKDSPHGDRVGIAINCNYKL